MTANRATGHYGRCSTCGKTCWPTRADAKRASRRYGSKGMNAYQCGGTWHYGHLPASVKAGAIGRHQITRPVAS